MVDKANDIYNRWANGQELPTIVLRHITDETSSDLGDDQDSDRRSPPTPSDPFLYTHQSLAQCIAEVHQIAKTMFPMRKPCSCSSNRMTQIMANGTRAINAGAGSGASAAAGSGQNGANAQSTVNMPASTVATAPECPPSHGWSPPPIVNATSPVLPDAPPVGYIGSGSGVAVGYPNYKGVSRNGNHGTYSSLKGSGMTPSPGRGPSPTFGNTHVNGNGGTYPGYSNTNGTYSPSSSHLAAPYSNNATSSTSSPVYANGRTSTPNLTGLSIGTGSLSGGGTGLYASVAVLPASAPPVTLPPASSKLGTVDTINFELGALSASSDQSFMVFY